MSTKIYNGWLCPSADIGQEIERLQALRPMVQAAHKTIITKWKAKRASDLIDEARFKGEQAINPLSQAFQELIERQMKVQRSRERDMEIDTACSVTLIPVEGRVLACVYSEKKEITNIVTQDMTYFGYWDNTDRPDDVTAEEWDERERLWEKALLRDHIGRPGGCGPNIEFLLDTGYVAPKAILEHLPSLEARARTLAKGVGCPDHVREHLQDASFNKIVAYLCSDEYAAILSQRAAELAPTLQDITEYDLVYNGKD